MKRIIGMLTGATAWFALIVQLVLSIQLNVAKGSSVAYGVWMYLAFFTILTNLLVAVMLTLSLLAPSTRAGRFFARAETITGITANIILVALVYNALLLHLNTQQGWRFVTDLLLHFIVPILTVVYWWAAVRTAPIRWTGAIAWAGYLIAYFFYAVARGFFTGFYPYYFINVPQQGLLAVVMNALGVLAAFFSIIAVLMVAKHFLGATASRETAA